MKIKVRQGRNGFANRRKKMIRKEFKGEQTIDNKEKFGNRKENY